MNSITRQRFDAIAGYSRRPFPMQVWELEFYEIQNERILGLLIREGVDDEYGGIVFGRDAHGKFRWVNGSKFFDNADQAREALFPLMIAQTENTDASFQQGDENGRAMRLLEPAVPADQMGELFKVLINDDGYVAAKRLIEAMSPYFRDLDGNFVQQFQTRAFDSRIFELYLFAMLHEMRYAFDETHNSPDFHCLDYGVEMFIEAVTVQPTEGVEAPAFPTTREELIDQIDGYTAIKFGSALYSKLQRKYWEREHVQGRPLVIAIQNFSGFLSTMIGSTALPNYLYGWTHGTSHDADGHLVVVASRIVEHRFRDKVIPSEFFALPGAENISAVIHNQHATIAKFNRMGVLAGFGSDRVRMIRRGVWKDHDPDAAEGLAFTADVGSPEYNETWTEGLSVYHNPNASVPVHPTMFPGAAHHFLQEDGNILSHLPERFPLSSVTAIIKLQRSTASQT